MNLKKKRGTFELGSEESKKAIGSDFQKAMSKLKEDVKGGASKIAYPFVETAQFFNKAKQEAETAIRNLYALSQGETQQEFQQEESLRPKGRNLEEDFLKLTEGRGPGENIVERATQGALATGHPAGALPPILREGQQELGIELPAPVQAAVDTLEFVLAIKSGKNIKLPSLKANRKVISNAEKVAAQTGLKVEEVIEKARQESGADLQKAAQGNANEINKLNRKISIEAPGAEKISKTEKTVFNPKEAIKQREAFGKKVETSPLADYFAAEKAVEHRPETLVKQKEITESLAPRVTKLEGEISSDRADLRQMQLSRKQYAGNELARVESNIALKERAIQKKMEELKDLQYEMKYFRKRPTEAEIDAAVKKSAEAYVEEARNPTPEGQKKAQKQLDLDKQYIENAENILNRGELPGEIRPDTHIKMKQKYLDGYNAMIRDLREEIKSLKGAKDAESLKRIADNKKAINALENRARRLKSDIVNQTDKIKAMKGLEGPSGAFYKQQLKGLHKDMAQFQHDFFKHVKDKTLRQKITEKTAEAPIKEVGKQFEKATKLGEEVGKNPTKENVAEAAKETGQNPETIKEETKKLGDEMSERSKKIKEGKATEKDINETESFIKEYLNPLKNAKAAVIHFGVGSIVGVIENEFGIHIRRDYLYGAASLAGKPTRQIGRGFGFGLGHSFVNHIYDKAEGSKLKTLRKNPNEYTKYIQSLRKRYGPKRINQMIEYSKD